MPHPIDRLNAALTGRYRIERQLGEGGMATVYLADDLKHSRKVALKVLKPELAAVVGAERFLAEIRTTASLQHPHILPLHDSGEADGFLFYVMPYVEGESLRDRLDRDHQLPVDEAVRIATNVAQALDYAHRHGVIHRDIKPANIMVHDGQPVISDFGIALAVTASGAGRLTETGLSLGTPHYMSPEQATGDQGVGPATDIWALGCVLYEMLVAEPPYTGGTPQAVLGKIITAEPASATEARRSVPANVDAAIRKALEKVPADRFGTADAFAKALADPAFRFGGEVAVGAAAARRLWNPLSVAMSVSSAILALAMSWILLSPESPAPVTRLEFTLPEGLSMPLGERAMDVSRDGSTVVFVGVSAGGVRQLWYRPMGQLEAVPIPGTNNAVSPRFSPDGRSVAFRAGADIRTVSLEGAPPQTVIAGGAARDLAWGGDDRIYFGNADGGISRVAASGGEPEVVTTPGEGETFHVQPEVLPNGRGLLFVRSTGDVTNSEVALASADGTIRVLFRGRAPRYATTGHILFGSIDAELLAVAFDLGGLEVTSAPLELVDGVWTTTAFGVRWSRYALSDNGVLVYVPGGVVEGGRQLVWVDRSGREEAVDSSLPPAVYNNRSLALSPDDRRLAVSFIAAGETDTDLWVKDLPDGPMIRLTRSAGPDRTPVWFRDGRTIAYSFFDAGINEIRTVRADGSSEGTYEVLLQPEAGEIQLTRDERGAIFRSGNSTDAPDPRDRVGDIGYVDLQTGVVRDTLFPSNAIERSIALSPDDRWLAYVSNVSGRDEVYVRPWPAVESYRVPVSRDGGGEPVFAHNGRELFYREPGGSMMVVTYNAGPSFEVVSYEDLFDASTYVSSGGPWHAYDVSRDDQRFVMIQTRSEAEGALRLIVVQNFFEELKRVVPE